MKPTPKPRRRKATTSEAFRRKIEFLLEENSRLEMLIRDMSQHVISLTNRRLHI